METVQKKWSCFCSCLTKTFNQWNILMTFAHVRVMIHSSVLWLSNCKNQNAHGNTAIGKVKFLFLKYFSLLFTRLSIKNRSVIVFWRTTAKAFEHSKAQLKYLTCVMVALTLFLLRPQTELIYLQGWSQSRDTLHQLLLHRAHIINITHKPLLSVTCRNLQKGKRAVVHENKHQLFLSA